MNTRFIYVLILAFILCLPGLAQTSGGAIEGVLLDVAGNPAAGTTLTIENTDTDRQHTASTDRDGRFRFDGLPVGQYRIVTDLGQTSPTEFEVRGDRAVRIELRTTAGGAAEERVTLELVPVESDTGQISTNFGSDSIELLPQSNYISPQGDLYGAYNQSLLSGAVTPPNPTQPANGPIVAGLPATSNNFHVDGADNNNRSVPGPLVYLSNEATSDFSLQQNGFSPYFGHAAGGQMNSIVSTGANQIHGSAYWYLQNRELNAMEPAYDGLGLNENPRFDQNRIGATVGAPIVKNKLFGLANFEYIPLRFDRRPLGRALVPTQAGFDALSRVPGISASNLDALRQGVGDAGDAVETATVNGTQVPLGLAATNMAVDDTRYMGVGAIDWSGTMSDQVSLRYVHNEIDSNYSGAGLPSFATPSDTTAMLATVGYTRTFTPNIVNNFRLAYNRLDQVVNPGEFDFSGLNAFPNVQIQGLGLGLGPQAGLDRTKINTYQLGDTVSFRYGPHDLRVGFDGRRILSSYAGLSSFRGDYTYSTLERFLLDQSPDVVARRSFGDPTLNGNQWLWSFHVQDTWKLTQRVNLELGLSSEYATFPQSLRGQQFNSEFDEPGLLEFGEPEINNFNLAPRVGIAFSPDSRTVFRAGAGMEYDALSTGTLPYLMQSPSLSSVTLADPLSQQAGFLNGGGVVRPDAGRGRIGSFIGNQELPYVIHWNAAMQKALVGDLTFEIKYLGNRGVHLPIWSRLNSISQVSADNSLPVFVQRPGDDVLDSFDTTLQSLRSSSTDELVQAGFTNPITNLNQGGTSVYNALVVGLKHRFSRGLHLTASYTYSDTEIDSFNSPFDLSLASRGRFDAPWEQTHRAVATGILDMAPLLDGAPGFVRYVVANLSLMGTYTYASEQHVPISSGLDTSLSGNALGSAAFVNPNGFGNRATGVTPLTNSSGEVVAYQVNDPTARFVQGGFGTFASGGVPMLPLDQTSNFDVAAVKRFGYRDVAAFELRVDAYNVFNHAQFTGNQIRAIGNPLLGASGATALPGFLNPTSSDFANLRGWLSGNPRTLQVALRVSF